MLTLGAGLRSLAPQHGGYKDVDADDIYTRPLAIRMRGTVNWLAGWSIFMLILPFLLTRGLLPAC